MARIEKDGTKVYQTEDRQYKVKEQLLGSIFSCIDKFADIIVTADQNDPYGDPRFDALTLYMTTFALSEEECLKIIDERDAMIDKLDFSVDKKILNRKMFMINIKTIVRCQSNFDNYYGIKKRQEIMRLESPAIIAAKKEFGGEDYLGMMFAGGYKDE